MKTFDVVTKSISLGEWKIELVSDEDGHLSIHIDNRDGSQVNSVGADIADDENQWAERFTTNLIEQDYKTSNDKDSATNELK